MIHPTHDMMYFGDDYGGHNIPFPHPAPPKPHKMYDQHAFIDLSTGEHVDSGPAHPNHGQHHPDPAPYPSTPASTSFKAGEKDGLKAGLTAGY